MSEKDKKEDQNNTNERQNDKNVEIKEGQGEKQEKSNTKYDSLTESINQLTNKLEKRAIARKDKKIKKRDELNDLVDSIEEQSNITVSKLDELSRKPTIFISISKILPEIPEGFPKNYNVQIVYEDVIVTGNQKFVDFDENVIDQKFILPLLDSEIAKFEIWVAEEEPSLYDKAIINLEKDLQQAIVYPNYQNKINFQSNPDLQVSYTVTLQGIGFSAWLKNLQLFREVEQERKKIRRQTEMKTNTVREKVQQRKNKFKQSFGNQGEKKQTMEYNIRGIEDILNELDD